jgi:sulfopropanediol 3-dehydrogenase
MADAAELGIATSVSFEALKTPAQKFVERGSTPQVRETVENVIADIRTRGDEAVREYSLKFDKYGPESFLLSDEQLN